MHAQPQLLVQQDVTLHLGSRPAELRATASQSSLGSLGRGTPSPGSFVLNDAGSPLLSPLRHQMSALSFGHLTQAEIDGAIARTLSPGGQFSPAELELAIARASSPGAFTFDTGVSPLLSPAMDFTPNLGAGLLTEVEFAEVMRNVAAQGAYATSQPHSDVNDNVDKMYLDVVLASAQAASGGYATSPLQNHLLGHSISQSEAQGGALSQQQLSALLEEIGATEL